MVLRSPSSFLLLSLLLLFAACDPAVRYRPTSGTKSDSWNWAIEIDGVKVRAAEYEDIDGIEYFAPQIALINSTDYPAIIEDARLITATAEYEVDLPGKGEIRWRRAAPHSEASIPLSWWFDQAAVDVIGDRPMIILDLRIGEQEHQVEIKYERVK